VIGRFLRNRERLVVDLVVGAAALAGPLLLTAVLLRVGGNQQRYYVFLYLGLVSVVATLRGLWPALVAAAASFICLDYYFVSPVGTLNIKREEDLVNLIVFFGAAGLTGWLASRRRHAQQRAQDLELTHRLRGELLANISHDLRTPIATILTDDRCDALTLDWAALLYEHTTAVRAVLADERPLVGRAVLEFDAHRAARRGACCQRAAQPVPA